jgi:hypothetical protein
MAKSRGPGQVAEDVTKELSAKTHKKAWEYEVSAAIPYRNTPEYLEPLLRLLRLQTVRPYIMICDTGSLAMPVMDPEKYRAPDCEVYRVVGTWQHPCEVVAVAMDLMQSACRTKYFFSIHTDCFPRRRDLLEWMMAHCNEVFPVVGHELCPRSDPEWRGYVGHTATMFHMPTIHKIGMTWSMRRLRYMPKWKGRQWRLDRARDIKTNWPDTETTFNRCLVDAGLKPLLIGKENISPIRGNKFRALRTVDEFIDHVRNGTIHPDWRKEDKQAAIKEAWDRVRDWVEKGAVTEA